MKLLANYFSDETLTFMLLIISFIIALIGFIPPIRAEIQLKKYNATLSNEKNKSKRQIFVPKPNTIIWWTFCFVFILGVFIGALKYTKDVGNRKTYSAQMIELDTIKAYYTTIIYGQRKYDSTINSNRVAFDNKIIMKIQDAFRKQRGLGIDSNFKVHNIDNRIYNSDNGGVIIKNNTGGSFSNIKAYNFYIPDTVKKRKPQK